MEQPARRASSPPGRGARSRSTIRAHRRATWIAFGISALVHLAVILVYPSLMEREIENPVPFLLPNAGASQQGMEAIVLVEVDELDEPERPPEPDEPEDIRAPVAPDTRPDLGEGAGDVLVPPSPTAAERLRADLSDRRLWSPIPEEALELTLKQRLELELAARIAAANDSAAAADAAARRATDWTYTDDEGRRWGVSPGQLHLGDVTLPLPFSFGVNPAMRDAANRRAWEWQEIERGAAAGLRRDSWKERAAAIRERRDRERAAAKPDTSGVRR